MLRASAIVALMLAACGNSPDRRPAAAPPPGPAMQAAFTAIARASIAAAAHAKEQFVIADLRRRHAEAAAAAAAADLRLRVRLHGDDHVITDVDVVNVRLQRRPPRPRP